MLDAEKKLLAFLREKLSPEDFRTAYALFEDYEFDHAQECKDVGYDQGYQNGYDSGIDLSQP